MRQKLALFEKINYICRTNKKLGVMKKHVLILLAIVGIIYACMAIRTGLTKQTSPQLRVKTGTGVLIQSCDRMQEPLWRTGLRAL